MRFFLRHWSPPSKWNRWNSPFSTPVQSCRIIGIHYFTLIFEGTNKSLRLYRLSLEALRNVYISKYCQRSLADSQVYIWKANLDELMFYGLIRFHLQYGKLYSNNGYWNEVVKKAVCSKVFVFRRIVDTSFVRWRTTILVCERQVFFNFTLVLFITSCIFIALIVMGKLLFTLVVIQWVLRTQ